MTVAEQATVFFAIVTLVTVHFSTISGKNFLVFNVIACSHFEAVFPTAEVRKSMR